MPLLTVLTADLAAAPLLLRRRAESDFAVEVEAGGHGRLSAGRIMLVQRSAGREAWLWTVTGPAAPDAGVALSSEAETRQEAQEAFRRAFDSVIAWAAQERGGRLAWHAPVERVGPG